ncbi:hypothetical protein [Caballeronia sp.]|uniref:SLAC1 family transporter n=1 Tax=Caballeronia sp. TaxID=1931223 RepID=UPI003C457F5B
MQRAPNTQVIHIKHSQIGTGSLGLLLLGQAPPAAFDGTQPAHVAMVARDFGVIGGSLLWGAGLWWLVVAIALTLSYLRDGMTFNMGWWRLTFPIGVYASAIFTLDRLTQFTPLAAIGTVMAVMAVALVGFWLIVVTKTLNGMWLGSLFRAPCRLRA